ncbi:MAG: TetR/AcrR family transcriptional regulator [Acidimicrobiales bacterium]
MSGSTDSDTGERPYGGRSPSERRADRRARLLAAGLELFGTAGYAATTIEQLCSAAGVATRNFYEEFDGRESLLIALHDDVNLRAFAAVTDVLARADLTDVEARVTAGFAAYLEVMTADPRWARIAIVEAIGATPATHAARRAALARFADLLAAEADRMAAAGLIEARDYSLTSVALVGALTALVETWTADAKGREQIDQIAAEATRFLVTVLASRG